MVTKVIRGSSSLMHTICRDDAPAELERHDYEQQK